MPAFAFNEERHEYTLDGVLLPSVTRIIKPLSGYGDIPEGVLAKAAARGRAVHRAIELLDRGTLVESSLDPQIVPYVNGYRRFVIDHDTRWDFTEMPMYHGELLYAGTPDMIGVVDDEAVLVDLKSTAKIEASINAQLAGYALLLESWGIEISGAAVLHLKRDGTYQFDAVAPDFDAFRACLRRHQADAFITRWRKERKL